MYIINKLSDSILPLLLKLTNNIIETSKFPECLKIIKIMPIPKSNDYLRCDNYRPINLVSPISKIIEKVWNKYILNHLKQNKLIKKYHQGSLKNRSSTLLNLELHNKLIKIVNKKKIAAIVALDQSACFDIISHNILIRKIRHLNFSENTLKMISSYLENRKQNRDKYPKIKRIKFWTIFCKSGICSKWTFIHYFHARFTRSTTHKSTPKSL